MADELESQNTDNEKMDLRTPTKVAASTAAGAGIGVMSAVAVITTAAAFEVVLPVGLCLWAGGVTFGAIGLLFGMGKKK